MKITYLPQDEDDPHKVVAYDITFPANVPVEVDPKAGYEIEETKRVTADDGTWKLIPVKRFVTIVEMARGNPTLTVEGEAPPAKRGPGRPRKVATAGEELGTFVPPADLENYRPDDGMPADR